MGRKVIILSGGHRCSKHHRFAATGIAAFGDFSAGYSVARTAGGKRCCLSAKIGVDGGGEGGMVEIKPDSTHESQTMTLPKQIITVAYIAYGAAS
ncbi:hypothetical protein [Paracoccus alkanivorans]|uniref:hypothetical protein n=1 Tax=Paracoccus alkanivorans TaxID=2116655 RepID=UPI0011C38CB5|nr:hypothetical protein [Paracoccus alkanivorans]